MLVIFDRPKLEFKKFPEWCGATVRASNCINIQRQLSYLADILQFVVDLVHTSRGTVAINRAE